MFFRNILLQEVEIVEENVIFFGVVQNFENQSKKLDILVILEGFLEKLEFMKNILQVVVYGISVILRLRFE